MALVRGMLHVQLPGGEVIKLIAGGVGMTGAEVVAALAAGATAAFAEGAPERWVRAPYSRELIRCTCKAIEKDHCACIQAHLHAGEPESDAARASAGRSGLRSTTVDSLLVDEVESFTPATPGLDADAAVVERQLFALKARLLAIAAEQASDPLVSERLRAESSLLALRSSRSAGPLHSSSSPATGANDASA